MDGYEISKAMGYRIAQLRTQRGKSQREVAEALGETRSTVTLWENGERAVKASSVVALAKYFNVSADYILCMSDVSSPSIAVQKMCEITGLSEDAAEKIVSNYNHCKFLQEALAAVKCPSGYDEWSLFNDLLSTQSFWDSLSSISNAVRAGSSVDNNPEEALSDAARTEHTMLALKCMYWSQDNKYPARMLSGSDFVEYELYKFGKSLQALLQELMEKNSLKGSGSEAQSEHRPLSYYSEKREADLDEFKQKLLRENPEKWGGIIDG